MMLKNNPATLVMHTKDYKVIAIFLINIIIMFTFIIYYIVTRRKYALKKRQAESYQAFTLANIKAYTESVYKNAEEALEIDENTNEMCVSNEYKDLASNNQLMLTICERQIHLELLKDIIKCREERHSVLNNDQWIKEEESMGIRKAESIKNKNGYEKQMIYILKSCQPLHLGSIINACKNEPSKVGAISQFIEMAKMNLWSYGLRSNNLIN